MTDLKIRQALEQNSYFVQDDIPDAVITDLLEYMLDSTDLENIDLNLLNKKRGSIGEQAIIENCAPIKRFRNYIETSLGAKYPIIKLGFPLLQKKKTGTGIHYDRSYSIFDSSDVNTIQCWMPIWEQDLPESGLRIYPRFMNGTRIYDDKTYQDFIDLRIRKRAGSGREMAERYNLPEEIREKNYIDFSAHENLGRMVWFNSNCLHTTIHAHNPVLLESQKRIALAIRFVRKDCPLRTGFTLDDLHRNTNENEYLRSYVEDNYF